MKIGNTMSEDGSCGVVTRRQLKKVITLFLGKNETTPSVAGTIDYNPSDATS